MAIALFAGALPLRADEGPAPAGDYLAARAAHAAHDFAAAARHYQAALATDAGNEMLLERAVITLVSMGEIDAALPLAQRLSDAGPDNRIANLVVLAGAFRAEDWNTVFTQMESAHTVSPLVDGMARAWGYVGRGEGERALSAFDEVIDAPGLRPIAQFQKVLALAVLGDEDGAEALLSLPPGEGPPATRRSVLAHSLLLHGQDRTQAAIALLTAATANATDPELEHLLDHLRSGGQTGFTMAENARDGMAELLFTVASMSAQDEPDIVSLVYARLALALNPEHSAARLMTAAVLDALDQHALAAATFSAVPHDDPTFLTAEMGRAEALRHLGQMERATEVLAQLARRFPDEPRVHAAHGDILRRQHLAAEGFAAYNRALQLYPETHPNRWRVLYTRGVTANMQDNWPQAEADFRAALELRPNQPQVLNFLGYGLVERREHLEEALEMIERAVAAQPRNGAIVDSLGWALYRLGRYDEAVEHLERAVELRPTEAVLSDHLGDALWAVGRAREARFQWQRALSFSPEDELAARIRRKLDEGLDRVLAEEGQPPLQVAEDDG